MDFKVQQITNLKYPEYHEQDKNYESREGFVDYWSAGPTIPFLELNREYY